MKVVNVRSPFIITVAETGQIGSKIELSIGTEFYSLSKAIPSTTQISTYYNVSNYVKEFIDNIKATYSPYTGLKEQDNEWTRFQVKRYKLVGSTYTLLDTTEYVGVNGFTNYIDGNQVANDTKMLVLLNTNINNYYYKQDTYPTIIVKYERIDGIVYSFSSSHWVGDVGIFNIASPISPVKTLNQFINGCKITITYTPATGSPTILPSFYTYPIEECKYTPVLCDFVNRYGGWQTITFFKAQNNNISVKGTDYKLTQNTISYNGSIGQFKTFNTNGKQTIKLNTGFVDENYSELITDLLLSETVLLDSKPVTVKTQGSDLKTSLKDKLINYEIEFEYAYNLINDVV